MPVRTRRWNDPPERGDGRRILVCRYRPRGLRKAHETWHEWRKALAPSVELHADAYGKRGRTALAWPEFRRRYRAEMRDPAAAAAIDELARRVAEGKTITLLCSSACTDESRCHRSLLAGLIAARAETLSRRRA
jgi:uncharacterized protein YeaO (DUF488 family)